MIPGVNIIAGKAIVASGNRAGMYGGGLNPSSTGVLGYAAH